MKLFGNKWKDDVNTEGNCVKQFDIKKYAKVYKNIFTKDQCKHMIEVLSKDDNWIKHQFYDNYSNSYQSYDYDLDVMKLPDGKDYKEIMDKTWGVIKKYIDDLDFMWFNGWKGYTPVRFNRYNPGTKMKIHCDHIHTVFDGQIKGIPILSIVGCFNDDYQGGEFVMWEKKEIKIPAGSVLVFPSNFLYPHKVCSVKKGVRYSYVSWVY